MTLQQLNYFIKVAESQSMRRAAEELFITQPTISKSIRELEKELGIQLFSRTTTGIRLTITGQEFLGYAKQVLEQYDLLEARFKNGALKQHFSVSTQHYSFAVEAFIQMAKQFNKNQYEFALHECRTFEVIENVQLQKSELGILYMNSFNRDVLTKILDEKNIVFHELFPCRIFVYLSKSNPLAKKKVLTMEDLNDYPCLSFEQGLNNSFYFSEEVFSTYQYNQIIKVDDRATMLNFMKGLNGYTMCSGILCEKLNGDDFLAIPFDSTDTMHVGYIKLKRAQLSALGNCYLEELSKYKPLPH